MLSIYGLKLGNGNPLMSLPVMCGLHPEDELVFLLEVGERLRNRVCQRVRLVGALVGGRVA
jgi:hypothetical protein